MESKSRPLPGDDTAALRRRINELEGEVGKLRAALEAVHDQIAADGHQRARAPGTELQRYNEMQMGFAELRERLGDLSSPWTVRAFKSVFTSRLDLKWQHPPRAIKLPAHYGRTRPPDPAPRISIVTPVRNQVAFIGATMSSVLEQGYPNLQYIVCDGASDDGTMNVVQMRAADIARISSMVDDGQADAVNRGLAEADGEIQAWLNGDDLLCPGSLAYVARYFVENPGVDIVYGHRILINRDGLETGRWVLPPHDGHALKFADFVPQETLFWRRRVWEMVGPLDTSFQFALDWDFLLRAAAAGMRFARLPRFIGCFRVHDMQKSSISLNTIGAHEMDRLRHRALGGLPDIAAIRRNLRGFMLRHVLLHHGHRLGFLRI